LFSLKAPTLLDLEIVSALSTHIPLIILPRLHGPRRDAGFKDNDETEVFVPPPKLSAFRPPSAVVLRNGLFHSPETVALLRSEAADRFLKWREVERSVEGILCAINADNERGGGLPRMLKKRRFGERDWKKQRDKKGDPIRGRIASEEETYAAVEGGGGGWSKAKWEAEWLENFSKDVDEVRRKREMTITEKDFLLPRGQVPDTTTGSPLFDPDGKEEIDGNSNLQQTSPGIQPSYTAGTAFDPLHLPSLIAFSLSLLCPLKTRLSESVQEIWVVFQETRLKLALLGGFCIGVGVGAGLFSQ